MADLEKVVQRIEYILSDNRSEDGFFLPVLETVETLEDALELLKAQEARELTMNEWREWKADSRRNPICMLWENDTSPMWILNPNVVHEPALLMGKLKLFTGKPTFEQCKAVKWE